MIWPFIILSYTCLFVFGLTDNVRGPLFPEILKQFQISDSVGSLMFALSNISGFISSVVSRRLLHRFDRLSVIQAGAVGLILSLWVLAITPNFSLFLCFSFTTGFCLGILGLLPNILVTLGTPPHRQQQMLSGLHMMYGLASLFAPMLAASVQHVTGNWRWTFAAVSLAPLSLLIYTFHKSHRFLHTKTPVSKETLLHNRKKYLKPQLFLALMLSFAVATEILISSRLALYMQRARNLDMEAASLYVTSFFICMMFGRLLFAVIPIRRSPAFLLTLSLISTGIALLGGVFGHASLLAFIGFTIAPFYPLTVSWISFEFPDDLDTAVTYMMSIDSFMLIIMHILVGRLTDLFSIQYAILFGLVFVILSLIMVHTYQFVFKDRVKKAAQHPSQVV